MLTVGFKCSKITFAFVEKYSRGRRGAPAKGIGRVTGARVQIPPSPLQKAIVFGGFFIYVFILATQEMYEEFCYKIQMNH